MKDPKETRDTFLCVACKTRYHRSDQGDFTPIGQPLPESRSSMQIVAGTDQPGSSKEDQGDGNESYASIQSMQAKTGSLKKSVRFKTLYDDLVTSDDVLSTQQTKKLTEDTEVSLSAELATASLVEKMDQLRLELEKATDSRHIRDLALGISACAEAITHLQALQL